MQTARGLMILLLAHFVVSRPRFSNKINSIASFEGYRTPCCFIDIFCSEVCFERGERPINYHKRSFSLRTNKIESRHRIRHGKRFRTSLRSRRSNPQISSERKENWLRNYRSI